MTNLRTFPFFTAIFTRSMMCLSSFPYRVNCSNIAGLPAMSKRECLSCGLRFFNATQLRGRRNGRRHLPLLGADPRQAKQTKQTTTTPPFLESPADEADDDDASAAAGAMAAAEPCIVSNEFDGPKIVSGT